MPCDLKAIGDEGGRVRYRCKLCRGECVSANSDPTTIKRQCGSKAKASEPKELTADEAKELFGESDPSLLGNRIAALTSAIGIPPCGGCHKRRDWLNRAHSWLREKFGAHPSDPAPRPGQHDRQGNGNPVV